MPTRDRLTQTTIRIAQAVRIANVVFAIGFVTVFALTIVAAPTLEARVAAKYGARVDAAATIDFLRVMLLFGPPVAIVVERMLRDLIAVLRAVAAGTPFARGNADRLRTIGWMLLLVQLLDLGFGLTVWLVKPPLVEATTWQPSPTGWLATLVTFVLVRVFAAGAALDEDLEGTV